MKKMLWFLLVAALLLALPAAQAELAWQAWVQMEPGHWQRTGKNEDEPLVSYQQLASGPAVEGLLMTEESQTGLREDGSLAWTYRMIHNDQGHMTHIDTFNYDEAGRLTTGSRSCYDAAGTLEKVWACILTRHEGGGFTTQVELYDPEDTLLSTVKTAYDQEGSFISSEALNLETRRFEALDGPPEVDPIREEWLREVPPQVDPARQP